MANNFKVQAIFTAKDDASNVIRKLRTEQDRLSKEVDDSARSFGRGEISADEYAAAVNRAALNQRKLDDSLKTTSTNLDESSNRFSRFGAAVQKNIVAITASLAALTVAFRQIRQSAEEAGQSDAFARNLASQGIAADEFIAKLREVSNNQIANADLILASNRALALGIQATDLPGLLDTAARASVELGVSVTQAFNDITTGVGRASPLILDNLGIVVDATAEYEAYAAGIGVSVDQLTKQQKTIALTNAVMKTATAETKNFSEAQSTITQRLNQSQAAWDNFTSSLGTFAGGVAQGVVGGLTAVALGLSLVVEAGAKAVKALSQLAERIPLVGDSFKGVTESLQTFDDGIDGVQQRAAKLASDLANGFVVSTKYALGIDDINTQLEQARLRIQGVNDPLSTLTSTIDSAGDSSEDSAEKFDSLNSALDRTERDSSLAARGLSSLESGVSGLARAAAAGVSANDRYTASLQRLTAAQRDAQAGTSIISGGLSQFGQGGRINPVTVGGRNIRT